MSSSTTDPAVGRARDPVVVLRELDLPVQGMTCTTCAARIEKKLNRMDGVTASVNYATETAHVAFPATLDPADLVTTVERTGYHATLPAPQTAPEATPSEQDGAAEADLWRRRLLISAALSLPVLAMAMITPLQFPNWQWVSLVLASPVAIWGAWPFHRAAVLNARHRATTMDTLVSLGVTAAYLWSLYALVFTEAGTAGMTMDAGSDQPGAADIYLEVAAVVTTFLLAGRYAEIRAKRSSGAALRALIDLGAKDVAVLRADPDAPGARIEQRIPISRLAVGDEFVVRPGEKVATDALVLEGTSALDVSLLTGENLPVEVGPGAEVTGATVNTSGRLVLRAVRVGPATRLAQITALVSAAQSGKAPVQRLADRVSAVFVPVVIVIAVLTLALWLAVTGDTSRAITAAVAVLIVACPCALGLATPTALLVGTGRGAQLGVLIKGPQVLEQTRRADVIVLDKTGTVTEGRMSLVEVRADHSDPDDQADRALAMAAAVESGSEHPVARAIVEGARRRGLALPAASDFAASKGYGVSATVDGRRVRVGRPSWLREHGIEVGGRLADGVTQVEQEGRTVVVVAWDGRARAVLAVADTVKPSSAQAISQMRELGLRPLLLTGDNPHAAAAVAGQVGIEVDDVIAGVSPEGKVDVVRRLQSQGHLVALVGDGVNDAAALAQADLGLTMGSGSDVAIEAGDLTLVRSDLTAAVDAVRLARRTLATIKGNLFWAFAYNVAAIPLAAFGLLNPMIAGAAMAFSSVFVVTNSLRLRRFRPSWS